MTAAELLREVVNAKYYHWDIEPILARALADERNRALEEACEHVLQRWPASGRAIVADIRALKTDPAESGR